MMQLSHAAGVLAGKEGRTAAWIQQTTGSGMPADMEDV
jgi:hypothetical protein